MLVVRHRYECPLRWADVDMLGHVNNVRYVDYLQEARSALLRACLNAAGVERPEGGYVVVRHQVTFLAPLLFRSTAVSIESWVTEIRAGSFTLDHEIFHDTEDGGRVVYVRARTVLAPFMIETGAPRRISDAERTALAPYAELGERCRPVQVDVPRDDPAAHFPVHVRFSDLDIYRHVNNVMYFEYFQESRIAVFGRLREALREFPRINVVVAQTDMEYVAPITLRATPYDSWSVVTRMGNKSMVIDAEIVDGEQVLARSRNVLVFFDAATQTSVTPPPGYREAIIAALGGSLAESA
ncbi:MULTISPECIES: acyl-CoA thioesterase [unclassified Nocardioides]|uniref:acyl-CoA thioesterase n=1 Tax=unclassified Nocardioides TaxID=2615069 RepID=UPI000AA1CA47|nr:MULTISPECIES: thioesterase family protein [unclassified Nocardioides]